MARGSSHYYYVALFPNRRKDPGKVGSTPASLLRTNNCYAVAGSAGVQSGCSIEARDAFLVLQYLHPVRRGFVWKVKTRTLRPLFPARSRGGSLAPAPAGSPTWKLLADQASKETASELETELECRPRRGAVAAPRLE